MSFLRLFVPLLCATGMLTACDDPVPMAADDAPTSVAPGEVATSDQPEDEAPTAQATDAPPAASGEVVVYTALDQIYSEPILKDFENATGIRARAVYDTEAAKTTGLVNRLLAERDRPRCDVFWNNEIVRTLALAREGVLAPYVSPNAAGIPRAFKDPEGLWTGFAARARVLAYNTDKLTADELPRYIEDLAAPEWAPRLGMAYPLFGTTATHGAVLWERWGAEAAERYFRALKDNGVHVLDGNMVATRAVADGELDICTTDTDDANLLMEEGKPIDYVVLMHRPIGDGQGGTNEGGLFIPNTVSLVANGPNPDAGRALIDYLLRPETEAALAASPSAQIPLHPGVEAPEHVRALAEVKPIDPRFAESAERFEASAQVLQQIFGE